MDLHNPQDPCSDEEEYVYAGPVHVSEVKKHFPPNYRLTIGCTGHENVDEADVSLKLIETHSTPNILTGTTIQNLPGLASSASSPNLAPLSPEIVHDLLRLKLENMCSSDKPHTENTITLPEKDEVSQPTQNDMTSTVLAASQEEFKTPCGKYDINIPIPEIIFTLPGNDGASQETLNSANKTPSKNNYNSTPRTPLFKTPNISATSKRSATTPSKYENVASPVAAYIKNTAQVPLINNVCPKKPGISKIPTKNNSHQNVGNKENLKKPEARSLGDVKLPTVAYKPAKETRMVKIPMVTNMPQNQWAKQVASSIPRATIVKHDHRETSSAKKPLLRKQEESFDNLPLHQADLSLCTEKTSFTKPRK